MHFLIGRTSLRSSVHHSVFCRVPTLRSNYNDGKKQLLIASNLCHGANAEFSIASAVLIDLSRVAPFLMTLYRSGLPRNFFASPSRMIGIWMLSIAKKVSLHSVGARPLNFTGSTSTRCFGLCCLKSLFFGIRSPGCWKLT